MDRCTLITALAATAAVPTPAACPEAQTSAPLPKGFPTAATTFNEIGAPRLIPVLA